MVTGGAFGPDHTGFTLTEVLVSGEAAWKRVGDLPSGLYSLRGVSLENTIFVSGWMSLFFYTNNRCNFVHSQLNENKFSGGNDRRENGEVSDIVLSFDISSETWINMGTMLNKRSAHAMSLVPIREFIAYCQIDIMN